MTLMTRIDALAERLAEAAERSMHDDALDAFRTAIVDRPEHSADCATCVGSDGWDTGVVDTYHAWAHGDRCAYCGTDACAVTRSDILVCAGHADLRTDRYI